MTFTYIGGKLYKWSDATHSQVDSASVMFPSKLRQNGRVSLVAATSAFGNLWAASTARWIECTWESEHVLLCYDARMKQATRKPGLVSSASVEMDTETVCSCLPLRSKHSLCKRKDYLR